MKTKHTPGPWTIDDSMANNKNDSTFWYTIKDSDNKRLGEVKGIHCGVDNNIAEANAKLIAESPMMLKALIAIDNLIKNGDLVRDISKDDDFEYFTKQALRVTMAVQSMGSAIQKATS